MKEVMEYELKTKKKHLAKLQEYFKTDTKILIRPIMKTMLLIHCWK